MVSVLAALGTAIGLLGGMALILWYCDPEGRE